MNEAKIQEMKDFKKKLDALKEIGRTEEIEITKQDGITFYTNKRFEIGVYDGSKDLYSLLNLSKHTFEQKTFVATKDEGGDSYTVKTLDSMEELYSCEGLRDIDEIIQAVERILPVIHSNEKEYDKEYSRLVAAGLI